MLAFFVLNPLANSGIQTFSVTTLAKLFGTPLGTANTALTVYLSAALAGIAAGGFAATGCAAGGRGRREPGGVRGLPVARRCRRVAGGGAVRRDGARRRHRRVHAPARDMMVNAIAPPGATGKAFELVSTGHTGGAIAPVTFGWLIDVGATGAVFALIVGFVLLSIVTALVADRLTVRDRRLEPVDPASESRPRSCAWTLDPTARWPMKGPSPTSARPPPRSTTR